MKRFLVLLMTFSMCLTLCACGGNGDNKSIDPEHEKILSLLEKERYDEAIYKIEELRDKPETNEDGEVVTEALDDNQKQSLYSTATSFIDNYDPLSSSSSRSFYDNRTGEQVECETFDEVFDFISGILVELGDYEESEAYLKRIYKIDNMLLSYKTVYTDALGTEHESASNRYSYNKDGSLKKASSARDMFEYYADLNYNSIVFDYDENGNKTKATLGSVDSPSAIITYTYEDGKIKTETVKKSDGEGFTVTYVYDADGKLTEMQDIPRTTSYWGWDDDTVTVKFAYDENGNVVSETIETSDNRKQIISYEYEDGKLVYKEKFTRDYTEYGADHSVTPGDYTGWEYTYDEEGRVATVTELDLGYLDDNRNQVNYNGEPEENPDLEFPRVTTYTYGTFYGVEDK